MIKNTILKSIHKKQWLFYTVILILLNTVRAFPHENMTLPPGSNPLKITALLHINKIYNINTVDETYQIDGYMEYSWIDERMKFGVGDTLSTNLINENDRAKELIDNKLCVPALEMINLQGDLERANIAITISPNGKIDYVERFFGIFGSNMNYRSFPFDSQNFNIQIESFS